MLVITLSRDLVVRFVFPGSTAPFRPEAAAIGQPLRDAKALVRADPGLLAACKKILKGAAVLPVDLNPDQEEGYQRRIAPRLTPDGALDEIMVIYEPGLQAPRRELDRMRHKLIQAMQAQVDAIAYFDADDRLILCNDTYANMHPGPEGPVTIGMGFEEILRRNLRHGSIALPADQQELWIAKRLAERRLPYVSREIRQADGRWFRLIDRTTLGGGRVNLLLDITELKSLEDRLQSVITGSGFGTWRVDLDTDMVTLDDRAAMMLGWSVDEISPMPNDDWRAMMHPDDLGRVKQQCAACSAETIPYFQVEYRMRHRDGRWIWMQSRGGICDRHRDGRPKALSGFRIDITHQKAMEADLQLRALAVTAASDGIFMTDAQGLVFDANPASATMLGHTDPAMLIGRPWSAFFERDTVSALSAQLAQGGTWLGPALALRADGTTMEQELSLTQMSDGRSLWISRDVGARNALARDRMELRDSVNRAQRREIVNLLAAGLTHDLSNLTALISHLSDPAARGFAQTGTAVMDEIHSAARQMISLIEPIGQLGRREPKRALTDLAAVLSEAAGILQLGAPAGLKLRTHLPDAPLMALLDPMQLMQVLLNLGLNARDALADDGPQEIDLSLKLAHGLPPGAGVQTGIIPEGPFALFAIRDSGTGIPPEMRDQIWEPFFTTKKLRGTGLGLFVVADIVRAAGGAVALSSGPDTGTCFFIAWPLVAVQGDAPPA